MLFCLSGRHPGGELTRGRGSVDVMEPEKGGPSFQDFPGSCFLCDLLPPPSLAL